MPARNARFERSLVIRFAHCDPGAIVFYPQYFIMFNTLVEEWVSDALGIPYHELLGPRRTGLPTVSLRSEFKQVSQMGDRVTLGLEVERLGNRSIGLRLDCRGEDGVVRVMVHQTVVTTQIDSHRAIVLPDDLRRGVERFMAGTERPDIH